MQQLEFSIRKLDYRKWWAEFREYFGSQVVTHGGEVSSYTKADRRACAEFHRQHPNATNYIIIFEEKEN